MASADLMDRLKELPQPERERIAAALLVISRPKFHGSITIHYADGKGRKMVDNVTRDLT